MANTISELTGQLSAFARSKGLPISASFELTSRCNLQCKMCYVCSPAGDKEIMKKERTAEEWIKLAEQARDAGVLYLILTGGEVLLRKDFKEIYEKICMMGFHIHIYTNSTLITPEIAKWLGRIPPARVSTTIYGASEEMYERICGNANAFNQAMRGIDLLLAEGIDVEVKTTTVKGNLKDFTKLREIFNKKRVTFGMVTYVSPRREGCNTDPIGERLSPEEIVAYEKEASEYNKRIMEEHGESHKVVEKKDDFDTSSELLSQADMQDEIYDENRAFNCGAGRSAFWVTWDGRMTPCGLLGEPLAFPFEIGVETAWRELREACINVPCCDECKVCEYKKYCMKCPGRLFNESGAFDKPAPYLCEYAKLQKKLSDEAKTNI